MRPLLVLLTIAVAAPDPIIIRSGLNNRKDEARLQDAKTFDLSNVKGISNFEGEEGFNRDNESKHVQAQDAGKYNEEKAEKKLQSNSNNFAGDKYHQQAGDEVSDFSKKSANRKGHHKQGFTKSVHKDESESTSSFYDDSDDEGGEYVRNNKKNAYGDAGQHSQRGSNLDDRKYVQDQDKKGYYNNAGNYGRDLANRRDYHAKKYHDNEENLGRRNSANQFGEADRYGQERYLRKPYYEPEPYYPHVTAPKKTITIYEDPRYDGYEKYPLYDNDYIQLDLKRPPRDYDYRYYERGPSNDYYY